MNTYEQRKYAGAEALFEDEADICLRQIRSLLTSGDVASQLHAWSVLSVLKLAEFRRYLAQRPPYIHMTSSDRSQRLTEVMEILIGDGILAPLSVKETIEELGEPARNKGSFARVVNIHRLKRAAGISVVEMPQAGVQQIVREAPRAYDVFMAEQRLVLPFASEAAE